MRLSLKILLLVGFVILSACTQENDTSLPAEEQNTDRIIHVKNSDPTELQNMDNNQIAAHLSKIASEIPNVNNASAIVAGPYTVVGIDVDKDLDRSRVGTVKYSVSEALYHDPYGKSAIVVADGDVTERIRGMADKISQGHPVQGFVDELAAIVGRYMPEFPVDDDPAKEPDQNKELIDKKDEQKLDNIEEEQSKHHK